MYIDSTNWNPAGGDQTVAVALREALEPLLMKYKVDMCLWGHHHSYQRTCPVFREVCMGQNPDGSNRGPVHMVIGMAGMGLSQNIQAQQPHWFIKVDDQEYGYTRWQVTSHKLSVQFISDIDGGIRDSYTLTK